MRSFKELNKLTGSDQKDLLYSVTGHAGGLDYKIEIILLKTDGCAFQAEFTLEDVESSLTEVSMPDERLLEFLIDCFAHNKLQASCEEGTVQLHLTASLSGNDITVSLPPSGTMSAVSQKLAGKISCNLAFSLHKQLQQAEQDKKRPQPASPDEGSTVSKRNAAQAAGSPLRLAAEHVEPGKATSSTPSTATKAGPKASLTGPVRGKGRARPGAMAFGKPP